MKKKKCCHYLEMWLENMKIWKNICGVIAAAFYRWVYCRHLRATEQWTEMEALWLPRAAPGGLGRMPCGWETVVMRKLSTTQLRCFFPPPPLSGICYIYRFQTTPYRLPSHINGAIMAVCEASCSSVDFMGVELYDHFWSHDSSAWISLASRHATASGCLTLITFGKNK